MTGPTSSQQQNNDPLPEAVNAARRGDFRSAQDLAELGLRERRGEPAALHAFLGMIFARAANRAEAANHLKSAHELRPTDVTIACNLISILMEDSREEEALLVASEELARADVSLRVARYRGFLAQGQENFAAAVDAYQLVLDKTPNDFEVLNNFGNAKAGLGDHENAVNALKRAIAIDENAAPTHLNLAAALIALEQNHEAEDVLKNASERFPADSRPAYELYVHYKSLFKQDEAFAAIKEAAARNPDDANTQLKLAIEYGVARQTQDAERAYRRVIELNPLEQDAYLGLAIQYEHTNREEEFSPLIELARRNGIADGSCAFIETLELRRLGRFEDALERLKAIPDDVETIRTAHTKATLLERLKQSDEAFAAFTHANRLMAETPTEPLERAAKLRTTLKEEIDFLTPEWLGSFHNAAVSDDLTDPVFLAGFPRSGTTLLDTILMGHPNTVVMEEQPPLNIVEDEIGGMSALPDLDEKAIAAARRRYFEEVEKLEPGHTGKMLIDKSPLFLYRGPLINRLFPRAKIILALRHPCDVVLSCFMSNFRLNSAMSNFLNINDTATFYDLCFQHWQKSRALLPLDVHTIVYEQLVENVEAEVSPLLDWLGLERNSEMFDHQKAAKERGLITTASYSQVTEPIYKRASGRWERYHKHLKPVFDVLDPWTEEFGYKKLH